MPTSKEYNLACALFSEALFPNCCPSKKKSLLEKAQSLIDRIILENTNNISNMRSQMEFATDEEKKEIAENLNVAEERLNKYRLFQDAIAYYMGI